jgi:nitrogen fixation protein
MGLNKVQKSPSGKTSSRILQKKLEDAIIAVLREDLPFTHTSIINGWASYSSRQIADGVNEE